MANDFLKSLTIRAGAALEAEDRLIMGSGHIRGEAGGILRLSNERYYQFLLWKAVLASWNAKVEEHSYDLVIFDPSESTKHLAIFEMKRWMGAKGNEPRDVNVINEDIERLQKCEAPNSALIIFSANPRGMRDENLAFFESLFFGGVAQPQRESYCFPTMNVSADEVEFWVAFWPIKFGPLFSQQ